MWKDHRVYIAYDETPIAYDVGGMPEAPTLVLCDGVGCSGFIWKYLAAELRTKYRLVHLNYRGHGRSYAPANLDNLQIQDHCRDLLGVLEQEEIDQCVLLGHSMGVQTILEFAHRNPEKVQGLVPICGSYGRVLDTFHDSTTLRTVFPHLLSLVQRYTNAGAKIWKVLANNPASWPLAALIEINPALAQREDIVPYFEQLARMNPRVFLKCVQNAGNHSALPYVHEIEVPTLVVAGEKDQFTPRWLSEKLEMHLPKAKIFIAEEGTHIAPLESPREINDAILDFLEKLFTEGPRDAP